MNKVIITKDIQKEVQDDSSLSLQRLNAKLQDGESSDVLAHYGVKGMKWGVRKEYETAGSHLRRSVDQKYGSTVDHLKKSVDQKYGKTIDRIKKSVDQKYAKTSDRLRKSVAQKYKKPDRDAKTARVRGYKNRRVMSDKELQKGINRLQLERQYSNLVKSDISPGITYANSLLEKFGMAVAASAAGMIGVELVKEYMKQKMGG